MSNDYRDTVQIMSNITQWWIHRCLIENSQQYAEIMQANYMFHNFYIHKKTKISLICMIPNCICIVQL